MYTKLHPLTIKNQKQLWHQLYKKNKNSEKEKEGY